MSYTTKSVLIVFAVAVVSYFLANAVLPDKNIVADNDSRPVSHHTPPPPAPPPARPAQAAHVAPAPAAPVAVPAPVAAPVAPAPPVPAPVAAPPAAPVASAPPAPHVRWGKRDDANPLQKIAYFEFPDPRYQAPRTPVDTVLPAPPVAPAPEPPARPQRQGASPLRVAQSAVCTDVVNKAPVGASARFSRQTPKLFYFTHVTGASETDTGYVAHRWYRDGKLVQTKVRPVASASWRTHSNRIMEGANDVGSWRIDAVDNKTGTVLESATFVVE